VYSGGIYVVFGFEPLLAQAQGDEASGDTHSDHPDIAIDCLQVTHLSTP
jgi:hypothetical protein